MIQRVLSILVLCMVAGCGSGRVTGGNPYTPRYDPYPGYEYDRGYYGGHDPGYAYDYGNDPLVRVPVGAQPRTPSASFAAGHLADFGGAFEGAFAALHQRLASGESELDRFGYLMASPGVLREARPGAADSLSLLSRPGVASFVTYGLHDPQRASQVLSVEVLGGGSFGRTADSGLYVGVRQFGEPRYRWHGPLLPGDSWRIDAQRNSNLGTGSAAYVTLAVFNGDEVRVDGLRVNLGS